MRRGGRIVAVLALATAACSQIYRPPASAYRHYGDRLKAAFPFFGPPCGAMRWDGKPLTMPVAECYRFGASRLISGTIFVQGYGSPQFVEGAKPFDAEGRRESGSELVSDRYRLIEPLPERRGDGPAVTIDHGERAYRATFVGRETERWDLPGLRSIVLLERMERIERLPQGARR